MGSGLASWLTETGPRLKRSIMTSPGGIGQRVEEPVERRELVKHFL